MNIRNAFSFPSVLLGLILAGCFTNEASEPETPVDRGPTQLAVDGDPNGLWWDYATKTLYMADDNNNRILKWTDTGGISLVKNLPAGDAGLGQLVITANGTIVVTRFGNGTAGDVAYVTPARDTAFVVPSLNVQRRRIGLTVAANDSLYVGWFTRANSSAPRVGAVGKLFTGGGEPEVMIGLQKPVGVLAVGAWLYVADQDQDKIFRAPLANLSASTVFATVASPDLLCRGPAGSLFSGSGLTPNIYRIDSAGNASAFGTVTQQVHGVAYDSVNHRLFVADHDPDASNGETHFLHIRPVD